MRLSLAFESKNNFWMQKSRWRFIPCLKRCQNVYSDRAMVHWASSC